jgi:hypothetical protein
MSHYRKIDVRIWNDEKFNGLTDNGKLLFLFLLTHPHMTPLGGMRTTLGGLADELKWNKRAANKHFSELLNAKFIFYDHKNHLLIFRNFIKYNQPESPNVIKGWNYYLDLIPEGELKIQLIQQSTQFISENFSKAFQEALPEAFRKALGEAFAKGMPNQEQEHKQEHINNILILDSVKENTMKIDENEKEILLPTTRGTSIINKNQIEYWERLYPSVNVRSELLRMREFLLENPQYTPTSIGRFVTKQLAKENSEGAHARKANGGNNNASTAHSRNSTKKPSAFELAMSNRSEWAGEIG